MADRLRSRITTEGVERAGNRAMLRAVGFSDDDFAKPIVGVANAQSNITPCNLGLGALVARATAALTGAGAMPQTFGTPTVSDAISMGTEGMKYSLVSLRSTSRPPRPPARRFKWSKGVLAAHPLEPPRATVK